MALVGENGSGKTTLAKLLAGLYLPQQGRISWDGQDLAGMDITQVRKRVAVLFQDFVKYYLYCPRKRLHGPLGTSRRQAAIKMAATRSGADGFIEALPRGYDTYLGPQFFDGSDLSTGQWQRVALARAISHRFATVRLADHVYLLEAGRMIEHGDHEELMAHNGLYAELFTLQASSLGLYEAG